MSTSPRQIAPAITNAQASDSRSNTRIVLFIGFLMAANLFNVVDQGLPFLLIENIRKDIPMNDLQIGALGSIMYSLTYALAGILLAREADRRPRMRLIGLALVAWSFLTGLGALARNYLVFALCRVGVAVGEAGLYPAATSIIADLVRPARRRFALSFFFAASGFGYFASNALGGWLNDHIGWRATMAIFAIPGLVLGIVAWIVREPPRNAAAEPQQDPGSVFGALRRLWKIGSFRWLLIGSAFGMFASYSIARFSAVFLIRELSMTTTQAGLRLGLIFGICGIAGHPMTGFITDVLARKDERWSLWFLVIMLLLSYPCFVALWYLRDPDLVIVLLAPGWLLSTTLMAPMFHVAQQLGGPRMRALSTSVIMFMMYAVGASLGPLVTGAVSDALKPADGIASIGWALQVATLGIPVSAGCLWLAARRLREDIAQNTLGIS